MIQVFSDSNDASNWSSMKNFSLHILDLFLRRVTFDITVLIDSKAIKSLGRCALACSGITSLAYLQIGTRKTIVMSTGLIYRAGLVGDAFLFGHKGVSLSTVASVAPIIGSTRDQYLWRNIDVWPSSPSLDFDSIGKCTGCSMSPT